MAKIRVELGIPNGELCYMRGKINPPCKWLGFGRCEIFFDEIADLSGKFRKCTQCIAATVKEKE